MFSYQHENDQCLVEVDPAFRRDVLNGLAVRPRTIPARWLYDRTGSEMFEAITVLPEYYVTRTETALLLERSRRGRANWPGPERAIVEFGSGSSTKSRILLSAMKPAAYVPIDISRATLFGTRRRGSRKNLANCRSIRWKETSPRRCGFRRRSDRCRASDSFRARRSEICWPPDAVDLLRTMARTLGRGSMLLIGIDRIKDPEILVPAYDDAQGVTAAFNLNLLHRINRELRGTLPVDAFRHVALWNDAEARIEMHLEAQRDVQFWAEGRAFSIAAGDTIHTENSIKYGPRDARLLLRAGGWNPVAELDGSPRTLLAHSCRRGSRPIGAATPAGDRTVLGILSAIGDGSSPCPQWLRPQRPPHITMAGRRPGHLAGERLQANNFFGHVGGERSFAARARGN